MDDLGATAESSEPALSRQILTALQSAHAPVAVFANCQALQPSTLLLWQQAGATVGNHTATHLSVDAHGADDVWWKDVQDCHLQLQSILRQPVRYFRYPYLRYGQDAATRAAASQRIASLGYAVAHVTAATSEWLLAQYYEIALAKHDAPLANELAQAYVTHLVDSLQAAQDLAQQKTGHGVAQITLAHVNRLAADHLSDVLAALRARGWHFISLSEALSDAVYTQPDEYTGRCGCSWLARIPPAIQHGDVYVFGDYEDQIRARFEARVTGTVGEPTK